VTRALPAVSEAARFLIDLYRLDLDLEASRFVIEPDLARQILEDREGGPAGEGSPRSGVLVVDDEEGAQVGLYLHPDDVKDPDVVVEETSHLLYLAWHAIRDLPVSRLLLEIQGEVDRYVVARLSGRDAFGHFREFEWETWMGEDARSSYATAHRVARRYCEGLAARFPGASDTPALLRELRRYYRASPDTKLHPA
jgi:hypothetical protein